MDNVLYPGRSRSEFIRGVVAGGLGAAALGCGQARARAAAAPPDPYAHFQDILSLALVAEQLASTFYYTALTSRELMSDTQLGGSSTDPGHPGLAPNGNPANVRFLQAALDAEVKHATTLLRSGAQQRYTHFYFPSTTFQSRCAAGQLCTLGNSDDPSTFLGVQAILEAAFVGAYLAAIAEFVQLGHPASAELAANIAAVEAEHLFVGRAIAGATPANDLALQATPFAHVADAAAALGPFLSGQGFPHGSTRALAIPTAAEVAAVVGSFNTRIVAHFL